jgi:phenylalanyl-tRNA synthetase beta chain
MFSEGIAIGAGHNALVEFESKKSILKHFGIKAGILCRL